MGAWGTGPFENDDALDWLASVESDGIDAVTEALEDVAEKDADDYVEAPEATMALAAAALIAAAMDGDATGLPDEAKTAVRALKDELRDDDLVKSARRAVRRVVRNSELRELWEEGDDLDEWIEAATGIAERLA